MVTIRLFVLALLTFTTLALAGCQAQATPVPPLLPTEITPVQTLVPATAPLRYAFAANTSGFVPQDTLNALAQSALIEQLSEDEITENTLSSYDVIVAYGVIPDWNVAPVAHEIGIIINRDVPPLDEEELLQVVAQRADGPSLVGILDIPGAEALSLPEVDTEAARVQLAGLGYPDGITLTAHVTAVPGGMLMKSLFESSNIRLVTPTTTTNEAIEALTANQAHMALVNLGDTLVQQIVSSSTSIIVVPFYRIPISYLSAPGVRLEFPSGGWPIPSR